jgi:acetyl esterase/lipase
VSLLLALLFAQDPVVVELWPAGRVPGEKELLEEKFDGNPSKIVQVGRPVVTVTRPPKDKDTGAAIVVAPGGGYRMLAYAHEGTQVSEWLASIGVTSVLLKYRVPGRPGDDERLLPLADAQRALRVTRSKAAEWGVDPARIGILGFSAGGHLAAHAATQSDAPAYDPVDDADRLSCRPDFAVMVYPGGILSKEDPSKLAPRIKVTKDTPPSFLVVSTDDKGSAPGTLVLYTALRNAAVPVELHVFAGGGHGYGMRKGEQPWNAWPQRCEEWLRHRGLLKRGA